MLTPCLLFQEDPEIKLTIKGGTIVSKSPPFDTYTRVLIPALEHMGAKIEPDLKYHGLFPDLVGEMHLRIQSMNDQKLKAIEWTTRGDLRRVEVYIKYTEGQMQELYQEKVRQ